MRVFHPSVLPTTWLSSDGVQSAPCMSPNSVGRCLIPGPRIAPTSRLPPSQIVFALPGITHSHAMMFCEPSSLLLGFATKP